MEYSDTNNQAINNNEHVSSYMTLSQHNTSYRYLNEIQQMMFVFGEVADPLPTTVKLIEDIVRAQVIELLVQASNLASKRNSKNISVEDLIFLIRKDRLKVNRLRTYLSWKEVRKNTKDADNNNEEEILEEAPTKRLQIKLPWELANEFTDILEDSEEDEDEIEAYKESVDRLRAADEITREMTKDEYVHYSECRQSSFTYRKSKKFREWCYMSNYVESKPNDDIIDVLGFLTYEMVSLLTTSSIKIKTEQEKQAKKINSISNTTTNKDTNLHQNNIFSSLEPLQSPIHPSHIYEAYTLLQKVAVPLNNFQGGSAKRKVCLI